MTRFALVFLPLLLTAQPDPRELLRQSEDAIKQYQSYELESIVLIEMHGGGIDTKLEMPSSVSVRRPGRMRIASRSQAGEVTIVSDGEFTWYYLSPPKKYVKRAAIGSPESALNNAGMLPKNLPDVKKSIQSMKITGEETLPVGGRDMPCWVVETVFEQIELPEQNITVSEGTQRSWIRKSDHLSLQNTFAAKLKLPGVADAVNMTQSTRTTAVRLNVALPDSVFVFKPPVGAKATEDWTLPGMARPDVVGKPVPDFQAGPVDLRAWRGKVILLDFWNTQCVPCKSDLPALKKLQNQFQDQGLVIAGLNVGDDQAAVENFLAASPLNFPSVPAANSAEILSSLAISSYPTIVMIDRDGKVAAYEAGIRGETALRETIAKLGISPR